MFGSKHSYTTFFSSKSQNFLGIQLQEVGAKILLNGTLKMNRHTNRQMDTQRDKSTCRKKRAVALKSFTEWTTHKQHTDVATYRFNRPWGQII